MANKVTGKAAASAASKVLRDGRTSATSKTVAGSALSQRETGGKKISSKKSVSYITKVRSFLFFNPIHIDRKKKNLQPYRIHFHCTIFRNTPA
jgi:hypothetical protein